MTKIQTEGREAEERARDYWTLLEQAITDLHPDKTENYRLNIQKFLLHIAWHEGFFLKYREQMDDGPARSFLQFEAKRARTALNFVLGDADKAEKLSEVAERSVETLKREAEKVDENESYFPDGGRDDENSIEYLLLNNDRFAIYLARMDFQRHSKAIGPENKDHAWYWYKYWKGSGGNQTELEKAFKNKADSVDVMLGLPVTE